MRNTLLPDGSCMVGAASQPAWHPRCRKCCSPSTQTSWTGSLRRLGMAQCTQKLLIVQTPICEFRRRRSVELRAKARCYSFVDGGGWITPYFYRPVNPSVLASSPSKATLSEYQFGQNVNSRIQAAGCRRANAFKPCAIAPAAWRYSPRSAAFKTAYNKWRNRLIARASDLVSHPAAADLSFFGQTTAARLPC